MTRPNSGAAKRMTDMAGCPATALRRVVRAKYAGTERSGLANTEGRCATRPVTPTGRPRQSWPTGGRRPHQK
jgi:hypothetical protein